MTTTEDFKPYEPKPGDLCRYIYDGLLVEHDATCDQFVAGTVTDVRTGRVVRR